MRNKTIVLLLCLLLLPCLILPAAAQERPYVVDEAGLLLPGEISALEEAAGKLAEDYRIDPVILTVTSLSGSSAQDYADDYYDSQGYSDDGILFLLAMEEQEWYISTCGSLIYAVTDYGVQQLGEAVLPCLSEGLWFDAFSRFLSALPVYLDAYETGAPVDGNADYSGDYYHGDREEVVYYESESTPNFLLSLACGLAAAGITIAVMRYTMNTKRPQRNAGAYLKDGSWNLYHHRDLFLYSNVTKTRRQENKSSGGGSSVHRSSGGRSHGGGGGKF